MYEYFIGRVVEKTQASLVLEVGGIGYRFEISASTYEKVAQQQRDAGAGAPVRIFAHLQVREDAHRLYGFATEAERRLFERLLAVKGVGPQTAMQILSGTTVTAFVRALKQNDVRALEQIKHVGKKTAERVLLELREKADELLAGLGAEPIPVAGPEEDAVRALVSLGYTPALAKKAVESAIAHAQAGHGNGKAVRVEDLVKEALRHAS